MIEIKRLEQLLFEHNWGSYIFDIRKTNNPALISAGIEDRSVWKIFIEVDDRFGSLDSILEKFRQDNNILPSLFARKKPNYFASRENIDNVLYFIVNHEIGHWRYCPFDIDGREDIISGVAEGLKLIGFNEEEIQKHSQRLYNMFADIILNVTNMYRDKQNQKYTDGFLAFYAKEGLLADSYSPDFFIFIDSTSRLGVNDKAIKKFVAVFNSDNEKLELDTRKILEILTGNGKLSDKAMEEELSLDEKVTVYHALSDREKWHEKARDFAKVIGPYIKDQQQYKNNMSSGDDNEQGQIQNRDKQNPGNEKERPQRKSSNEEQLREMVRRGLKKGHNIGYAPLEIALDELYKERVEKILIEIQQEKGEALRLPISYLARREIEDSNFDINRVDWQSPEFGVDERGGDDLKFFEKQSPYFIDRKGFESHGQIPDILFLIDASGSMFSQYDPKQGTGPYDKLLRAFYSVFRYLEDSNQAQYMKFGALLFADMPNYFSGWHNFFDIQRIKDPLLTPQKYIGDSTTLIDPKLVKKAGDENEKRFWSIIVSDGKIGNEERAKEAVSYLAGKGNVSFISIGPSYSGFTNHVVEVGGDIHKINTPDDLPKIILGKAMEIYEN